MGRVYGWRRGDIGESEEMRLGRRGVRDSLELGLLAWLNRRFPLGWNYYPAIISNIRDTGYPQATIPQPLEATEEGMSV